MPTGYPSKPTTDLGIRLRDLRTKYGYSQHQLAIALGTQANRVGDWELGKHTPSLPLLTRIAVVYGTTVSQILKGVM